MKPFAVKQNDKMAGNTSSRPFSKPAENLGSRQVLAPQCNGRAATPAAAAELEIFEEDDIARAAVAACGFRYVTSKVMAGSEIKGAP
jgi:hypothetical protein